MASMDTDVIDNHDELHLLQTLVHDSVFSEAEMDLGSQKLYAMLTFQLCLFIVYLDRNFRLKLVSFLQIPFEHITTVTTSVTMSIQLVSELVLVLVMGECICMERSSSACLEAGAAVAHRSERVSDLYLLSVLSTTSHYYLATSVPWETSARCQQLMDNC